jgi:hypothetical protein
VWGGLSAPCVSVFQVSLPDATALVRLPAEPLASGGKIVGYGLSRFLRFLVFDFKKVHLLFLQF